MGWRDEAGRYAALGLAAVMALALLAAGLSAVLRIGGGVVLSGRVVSERPVQPLEHPQGGRIAELRAEVGQFVRAGAIVARLDDPAITAELALLARQMAELDVETRTLSAQLRAMDEPAATSRTAAGDLPQDQADRVIAAAQGTIARREKLQQSLAQIAHRIRGLQDRQKALQDERALLTKDMSGKRGLLDKGLIRGERIRELELRLAQLRGELAQTGAEIAAARAEALAMQAAHAQAESAAREELSARLADLRGQRRALETRRTYLQGRQDDLALRAPFAGHILDVAVSGPGEVVAAGQPVVTIAPADPRLQIVADLSPADVDLATPGGAVELRVPLRGQPDPLRLTGRVVSVSPDAIADSGTGKPRYRLRIALPPEAEMPAVLLLRPGQEVEAILVVEEHTVLSYLAEPVLWILHRALREV